MLEGSGNFVSIEDEAEDFYVREFVKNYTRDFYAKDTTSTTTTTTQIGFKPEEKLTTESRNELVFSISTTSQNILRNQTKELVLNPSGNMSLSLSEQENFPGSNQVLLLILLILCIFIFLLLIGLFFYICRHQRLKKRRRYQSQQPSVRSVVTRATSVTGLHAELTAQYDRHVSFGGNLMSPLAMNYSSQNHQVHSMKEEQYNQNGNQNVNRMRKHSTPVPNSLPPNSTSKETPHRLDPLVMTTITPPDDDENIGGIGFSPKNKGNHGTVEKNQTGISHTDNESHSELYNTANTNLTTHNNVSQNRKSGEAKIVYPTETKPLLTNLSTTEQFKISSGEKKEDFLTQPVSWFVPLDGVTHEPLRHSFVDLSENSTDECQNIEQPNEVHNLLRNVLQNEAKVREKDDANNSLSKNGKNNSNQAETNHVSRKTPDIDTDSLIHERSHSSSGRSHSSSERSHSSADHMSPHNFIISENLGKKYVSSLSEDSGWKGEELWEFDDDDISNKFLHSPASISPSHRKTEWDVRESRPVVGI